MDAPAGFLGCDLERDLGTAVVGTDCFRAGAVRMLEVLQAVSSYQVTGDRMTMTGSGGTLRFRSNPPAEVPR